MKGAKFAFLRGRASWARGLEMRVPTASRVASMTNLKVQQSIM